MESLPIAEAIKRGTGNLARLFDNCRPSLRNLAAIGCCWQSRRAAMLPAICTGSPYFGGIRATSAGPPRAQNPSRISAGRADARAGGVAWGRDGTCSGCRVSGLRLSRVRRSIGIPERCEGWISPQQRYRPGSGISGWAPLREHPASRRAPQCVRAHRSDRGADWRWRYGPEQRCRLCLTSMCGSSQSR